MTEQDIREIELKINKNRLTYIEAKEGVTYIQKNKKSLRKHVLRPRKRIIPTRKTSFI
jgi:CRISPR/Cas system-associated endonuclease Cas3-HD